MKAIVFIDVQNDFLKGGKLAYGFPAEDNVQKVIDFAHLARSKGWATYATADTHEQTVYDNHCMVEKQRPLCGWPLCGYLTTLEGKNLPVEHCIKGTLGHQIVDGLVKDADRNVLIQQGHIFDKHTFGSLELAGNIATDFAEGGTIGEPLDEIIIMGYCTSICVVSNALILRAQFPNTKITVLEDCCGDIDEESHKAALKVLSNCQVYAASSKDYK